MESLKIWKNGLGFSVWGTESDHHLFQKALAHRDKIAPMERIAASAGMNTANGFYERGMKELQCFFYRKFNSPDAKLLKEAKVALKDYAEEKDEGIRTYNKCHSDFYQSLVEMESGKDVIRYITSFRIGDNNQII